MGLDRGVLARIDRRLLAGLGQDETYRMVRVPATAAMWSTWKRYCDAAGLSMGHAIAILIGHELAGVLDDTDPEDSPVLPARAGEELVRRQADVTRREQEAEAVEDRLRVWNEELRRRERELEARERQAASPVGSPILPGQPRSSVGRNELCPCGSGRKYKRCHGSPASQRRRASGAGGLTG